jgi:hypothetical protein
MAFPTIPCTFSSTPPALARDHSEHARQYCERAPVSGRQSAEHVASQRGNCDGRQGLSSANLRARPAHPSAAIPTVRGGGKTAETGPAGGVFPDQVMLEIVRGWTSTMDHASFRPNGGKRWRPKVEGLSHETYRELHTAMVRLTIMRLQIEGFERQIERSAKAIDETSRLLARVRAQGF